MQMKLIFAVSAVAVALAACTTIAPPPAEIAIPAEAAAPATPAESAHDRLFRLFKESDEANLKRNR